MAKNLKVEDIFKKNLMPFNGCIYLLKVLRTTVHYSHTCVLERGPLKHFKEKATFYIRPNQLKQLVLNPLFNAV